MVRQYGVKEGGREGEGGEKEEGLMINGWR
jgi:hypothetical protein